MEAIALYLQHKSIVRCAKCIADVTNPRNGSCDPKPFVTLRNSLRSSGSTIPRRVSASLISSSFAGGLKNGSMGVASAFSCVSRSFFWRLWSRDVHDICSYGRVSPCVRRAVRAEVIEFAKELATSLVRPVRRATRPSFRRGPACTAFEIEAASSITPGKLHKYRVD